jgi:YHS domain-containing protein
MAKVKDVVCGMTVNSETTQYKSEYKGETYYFCASGCKTAFNKDPEKYLQSGQGEHHHKRLNASERVANLPATRSAFGRGQIIRR